MKTELTIVTSLICLTILGVVVSCTQPEGSKLLFAIIAAVGAIAGVGGTMATRGLAAKNTDTERVFIHIPHGLLICLLGYVAWWLALSFLGLMLVYETNEDGHLSNGAWKDIKGIACGLGIGGIIMFLLKLGGVL